MAQINDLIKQNYKPYLQWPELDMKMNLNFTGDGIIKKHGVYLGIQGLFSPCSEEEDQKDLDTKTTFQENTLMLITNLNENLSNTQDDMKTCVDHFSTLRSEVSQSDMQTALETHDNYQSTNSSFSTKSIPNFEKSKSFFSSKNFDFNDMKTTTSLNSDINLFVDAVVLNSLIRIMSKQSITKNIQIDNMLFDDFEIKLCEDKDLSIKLMDKNCLEVCAKLSVAGAMGSDIRLDVILKAKAGLTVLKKSMTNAKQSYHLKNKKKSKRHTTTITSSQSNDSDKQSTKKKHKLFFMGNEEEYAQYKINKYLENSEAYFDSLLGIKFKLLQVDDITIDCGDISERMRKGFEQKLKQFLLEKCKWEDYMGFPKLNIWKDTYIKDFDIEINEHYVDVALTFE